MIYSTLELLNKIWAHDDTYLLIVCDGKVQVLFSLVNFHEVQAHLNKKEPLFLLVRLVHSRFERSDFRLYLKHHNILIYGVQAAGFGYPNTWFYYLGDRLEVNPDTAMLTQAMQESAHYLSELS